MRNAVCPGVLPGAPTPFSASWRFCASRPSALAMPNAGGARWQTREITAQTGYNSGNLDAHFGLGDATVADSLVVDWPSGRRDTWAAVAVDRFRVLTEGTGTVSAADAPASARLAFAAPSPNPCRGEAAIELTLARGSRMRLECFDARGRLVTTALDHALPAGRHTFRLALPPGAGAGLYLGGAIAGCDRAALLRVARYCA